MTTSTDTPNLDAPMTTTPRRSSETVELMVRRADTLDVLIRSTRRDLADEVLRLRRENAALLVALTANRWPAAKTAPTT